MDTRRNSNERYQIRLYESNERPHTYATFVRLSRPNLLPKAEVKAFLGSDFQTAFKEFRAAFQETTGYLWEHRDQAINGPARKQNLAAKARGETEVETENQAFFWANPKYQQQDGIQVLV
jgi:hypothetical protein